MPTDKTPDTPKTAGGDAAPGLQDFKNKPKAAKPDVKAKSKPAAKPRVAKPPKPKKAVGYPVALFLAVLAAGVGAAGGWMLPKIFDPANAAPAQAITQNSQTLKTMAGTVSALERQTQTLKSGLNAATSQLRASAGQAGEIADLNQAVADLQSVDVAAQRAEALEPIAAKIDALETLITPEGEETGVASQLLDRLTALETRLAELQAAPPVSLEPAVISYSVGGSSGDKSEPAGQTDPETPVIAYDLAANFPRAAMLKALSVQSQNTQEPSWIRKLISKHVETDDVSTSAARDAINEAQALTDAGDIAGAIAKIESLNPTLRAAAHSWMIEAKKVAG